MLFLPLLSLSMLQCGDIFGACYIKFHYPDRKEVVEVYPSETIPCDEGYIGEAHGCDEKEVYCTKRRPALPKCQATFKYPNYTETKNVTQQEMVGCDKGFRGEVIGCIRPEATCTPWDCLVNFVYPDSVIPRPLGKSETVVCGEEYTGVAKGCNEAQVVCQPKNRAGKCLVTFVYPHYGETMTMKAEETKSCSAGYSGIAHGCKQNEVTCTHLGPVFGKKSHNCYTTLR